MCVCIGFFLSHVERALSARLAAAALTASHRHTTGAALTGDSIKAISHHEHHSRKPDTRCQAIQ